MNAAPHRPSAPRAGEPGGAAARDHLAAAAPSIARRIRSLRRPDADWSMRTSELLSSTVRRVLHVTERGHAPMTPARFWGLVDATVRSVVVDGIRRRSVRRQAMRILRARAESAAESAAAADPAGAAEEEAGLRADADALLAALSADERALIALRMRGLDWVRVADAMGISPDAARQRWTALRRKAHRIVVEGPPAPG